MFGIEKHIIQIIRTEILKHEEVCDIIIFGSRAKGNYKKGSDIDIAVKGRSVTFELLTRLTTTFNQKMTIPYHIDVVHYESISNTDLINHIDRIGISILHEDSVTDQENVKINQ